MRVIVTENQYINILIFCIFINFLTLAYIIRDPLRIMYKH
jgi:hypothetical protein